jgi:glucose-1-phosphate cytidylyltransferase
MNFSAYSHYDVDLGGSKASHLAYDDVVVYSTGRKGKFMQVEDMKVVILAGGFGTRLAEETDVRPKPMVEIGGRPILWHIMNIYAAHGFKNFIIALGYKGEVIKRYMSDDRNLTGDMVVDFKTGEVKIEGQTNADLDWKVELVETGLDAQTGGRLKRIIEAGRINGTFMMTYGDGVSNVDIRRTIEFHKQHGKLATMTAVRPPARFGHLLFEGTNVTSFAEKAQIDAGWINGGFFVLEPSVVNYIDTYQTPFEKEPLELLAREGNLQAYFHDDFWQCMDTLRDKVLLNELWDKGNAPWVIRK